MSWRDQLRKVTYNGRSLVGGSFRGVPFLVETVEIVGGRRGVTHQFPNRDEPYFEDLGREPRGLEFEAYVLGDGYLADRNRLIAAFEEVGPGELVHPYYGTRRGVVRQFRIREASSEGGIARFGITFEETEASSPFPVASSAGSEGVATAAAAAASAAAYRFEKRYNAQRQPLAALTSLTNLLRAAGTRIERALSPLIPDTQSLAVLKLRLAKIKSAQDIIRQAPKVLAELRLSLRSFTASVDRSRSAVMALLDSFGFTSDDDRPPATTAVRRVEQANWDELDAIVRSLLVIEAATIAAEVEWESSDDAVATRDAVAAALERQAGVATDDDFEALEDLRAQVFRAVPGEDRDLPRLVTVVPPATVPSLVLAYRLYGDLDRELDIVARNRVPFPGFIVGGTELEVLSRARR